MTALRLAELRSHAEPTAASKAGSGGRIWIAVIGSTLGAFMAVLNIQIVNSSLADIQGAIGAGIDDGGWISTSYLITEIIVIPLTGWLARPFTPLSPKHLAVAVVSPSRFS